MAPESRAGPSPAASPVSPEWRPLESPAPGQTWMLYLTKYGNRYQLRLRLIPYPGDERVIWERPTSNDEERFPPWPVSYIPSPSFQRVVVVWPGQRQIEIHVVDLQTGEGQRVPGEFEFVYWKDEMTLGMLNPGRPGQPVQEVAYDLETHSRAGTKQWPSDVDALRAAYPEPVRIATALAAKNRLPTKLREEEAALAVLRGVGLSGGGPLARVHPGPKPIIGVSPDGRYVATTSGEGEVVIMRVQAPGGRPVRTIELTHLVENEGVSVSNLRWSPDSQSVTFTESHYHPPRFYPVPSIFPVGQRVVPDPLDTTNLVRMYVVGTGRVATIAVGGNAFLMRTPTLYAPARKKAGG